MKKPRIKIPAIPSHIIRQYPSQLYKCSRTGRVFTLRMLQEIYSPKHSKQYTNKEESLTIEEKTHWTNNYENY